MISLVQNIFEFLAHQNQHEIGIYSTKNTKLLQLELQSYWKTEAQTALKELVV
jgi:hypothetical protein